MPLRSRSAALALAAFISLLPSAVSASTAAPGGGDVARLRVGHFSAGLGEVTVEVNGRSLVGELAYGEVSDYQTVSPGTFDVTFRAGDGAPGSPPVATAEVTLAPEAAGSVVIAGGPDRTEARAFLDDLSAPAPGNARVRLIHLAPGVPAVDARVREGVRMFEDAVFGEATSYRDLPPGSYDLEMLRAGTDQVLLAVRGVTVQSGSVYTMVGTGGGEEPVAVRSFVDAAGAGTAPVGGVAAGFGGAATGGAAAENSALAVPALAALFALVAAASAHAQRLRARAAAGTD
jgi:hypothetical protein